MIAVRRLGVASTLVAAVAALSGCSGTVQDSLGLGKRQPDEFQVVRRAPLILPPDYSLRPPAPGTTGPVNQDTSAQAEEILTGQPRVPIETAQSQGELALLEQSWRQAEEIARIADELALPKQAAEDFEKLTGDRTRSDE